DPELLEACRAGDDDAWRELVERYERLVFSAALQTGLDRDAAVDVFQQVWMELHRSLFRIRDGQALPRWLIVTTRRIAYRQAVVAGRWLHDVREDLVDPNPSPDSVVVALELRQRLEHALLALDERCRIIVRLLFLDEEPATYEEVSKRTGLSPDSVGPTRSRCLAKLKKLLGEMA
ncbi:MAG TPA: sigma-70 family RNA polymerase sigma factor, partial [bacterium]|nr:sigma-70 family RNA polymerase sigma factor [bacterium]